MRVFVCNGFERLCRDCVWRCMYIYRFCRSRIEFGDEFVLIYMRN